MSEIGEAFIVVRPDIEFGNLFRDVERQIRLVGEVVETQTESMEQSFRDLGDTISNALRDNFSRLVGQAESAGEGIQGAMSEAARQSDAALNDIGGALVFDQVARQAEATGERIERSFSEAARQSQRHLSGLSIFSGSFFGSIAAQAVSALGRATIEVGKFGLKLAGELEFARSSFESLLGSTSIANDFINEIRQLAVETPLEFSTLIESVRRVTAFAQAAGLARNEILPFITVLGDLTTVLGQPQAAMNRVILAFGQIAGRGKVVTQELRQISEALPGFNPFQALARGLGVTTAEITKLIEDGLVPANVGIPILIEEMQKFPGAAGAMARFTDTLTGQFQRFKDQLQVTLADGFTPLIPTIKDLLNNLTPLLPLGIEPLVSALGDFVGSVLPGLLLALEDLGPAFGLFFGGLLQGIAGLVSSSEPIIRALGEAFEQVGNILETLGDALGPTVGVLTEAIGEALRSIGPALANLIDALGPIVLQIAVAFGDVLIELAPVIAQLIDLVAEFFDALFPALRDLQPAIHTFVTAFAEGLRQIFDALGTEGVRDLAEAFGELAVALAELIVALTPLIVPLAEITALILTVGAEQLAQGFRILADVIGVLTPVIEFFSRVIGAVVGFVSDLLEPLGSLNGIVRSVAIAFGPLTIFLAAIISIFAGVAFAVNFLVQNALIPLAQIIGGVLTTTFQFLWQSVLVPFANFVIGVLTAAWNILVTIFQSVIVPAVQAVIVAFQFLWFNILSPIANFLFNVFIVAVQALIIIFIGPLIVAVATAIQIFTFLWQNVLVPIWNFLVAVFVPVFNFLAAVFTTVVVLAVQGVINVVTFLWQNVFVPIWNFIQGVLIPTFQTMAGILIGVLAAAFSVVQSVATFLWQNVLVPIGNFLQGAFNAAIAVARGAWNLFQAAVDAVTSVLSDLWHGVGEPIARFLQGALRDAIGLARGAWNLFQAAIDGVASAIRTLIGLAEDAIGIIGRVGDAISDLPGAGIVGDIAGAAGGALGALNPFGQHGGFIDAPDSGAWVQLHGRELILPLDDERQSANLLARSGLVGSITGPRGGLGTVGASVAAGTTIINMELNFGPGTTAADAQAIANTTSDTLENMLARRRLTSEARLR
jgi:tape measure domain-containing protein